MTIAPAAPALLQALSHFNRAIRAVGHRVDRVGAPIRRSEAALLRHLDRVAEARVGDIAAEFGTDASVISRHVGGLEALEYVERRPDPADARASLIALTDAGRSVLTTSDEMFQEILDDVFDDWSEERIAQVSALLEEVATLLLDGAGGENPVAAQRKDV